MFRRFFIFVVMLSCSAETSFGQASKAVLPERSYNFGVTKQGTVLTHSFRIQNQGTAPLTIERVDLSLPAMKARFRKVVPAGSEGTITIEWNTQPVNGEMSGEAVAYLNDPSQPRMTLEVSASVQPPIEVTPLGAVFVSVFKEQAAVKSVDVLNHEPQPLKILKVKPEGTHFKAKLEPVVAGKSYRLTVRIPPGQAPGRYTEAVVLQTDSTSHPTVRVPVNLFIKDDVYAEPDSVDFGQFSLQKLYAMPGAANFMTQTIMVKRRTGLMDVSVTCDLSFIKLRKEPVGKNSAFRLDVELVPDSLKTGPFSGTLLIRTSDKAFPELRVPVKLEVLP